MLAMLPAYMLPFGLTPLSSCIYFVLLVAIQKHANASVANTWGGAVSESGERWDEVIPYLLPWWLSAKV